MPTDGHQLDNRHNPCEGNILLISGKSSDTVAPRRHCLVAISNQGPGVHEQAAGGKISPVLLPDHEHWGGISLTIILKKEVALRPPKTPRMEQRHEKQVLIREPDTEETVVSSPLDVRSVMLTGLFVLALFYTFYLASEFVLPVVLALLLNFLLRPAVRTLRKARVPEAVGAAIILVGVLGGCGNRILRAIRARRSMVCRSTEGLASHRD